MINPALTAKLRKRAEEDQRARETVNADRWDQVDVVDRRNEAFLAAVIETHGWPGVDLVGDEGADDAWLLAQHAAVARPRMATAS